MGTRDSREPKPIRRPSSRSSTEFNPYRPARVRYPPRPKSAPLPLRSPNLQYKLPSNNPISANYRPTDSLMSLPLIKSPISAEITPINLVGLLPPPQPQPVSILSTNQSSPPLSLPIVKRPIIADIAPPAIITNHAIKPPAIMPEIELSQPNQPFQPPLPYAIEPFIRHKLMPFIDEFGFTTERFSYICTKKRLSLITLQ